MYKKLIYLMIFVLVVSLVSNAPAQLIFNNGTGDGLWCTDGNWVGGAKPTSTDDVNLTYNGPDPTVYAATATCARLLGPGYAGNRSLDIDGGTLTITGTAFAVAMNAGDNGIVNMSNGGTIDCTNAGGNVTIGNRGYGTLNMTGSSTFNIAASMYVGEKDTANGAGIVNMDDGSAIDIAVYLYVGKLADATGTVNIGGGSTIDVGAALLYGDVAGSTGTINLIDGTLACDRFYSRYGAGVMDITGGTFEIVGDERTKVDEYVADGKIIAYGGSSTVMRDYGVTTAGITTVWAQAIPPGQASNPSPADGAEDVFIGVHLSWSPGDYATSHDVYFGTSNPPPFIGNQALGDTSYDPGTLDLSETYYWRVDEVTDPCTRTGELWHFTTIDQLPDPYLNNGVIQIGVDLSKGGSITFLADADQLGINMINSFDPGRMVQQSYYAGPTPFEGGSWNGTDWAWNPVCAGDTFGHVSEVIDYSNDGETLYVKTIPLQWALNNVPTECTFEKWITLDGDAAKVCCQLNNSRTDSTEQYPALGQELPAAYSTDRFHRIFSYTGEAPFTDGALTQILSGQSPFEATERWAALVDNSNWGFGLFNPESQQFGGAFFGTPGSGNPTGYSTGYISPRHTEILDYNIVYTYDYYLIVGNLDTIRSYAYQHRPATLLPDYQFEQDRQHWVYSSSSGTSDTGWPIEGMLQVNLNQTSPQMIGPAGIWAAADVPKLYIRASYNTTHNAGLIYWRNFGDSGFTSTKKQAFTFIPDGEFRTYEVDLSSNPNYSGMIYQLRLDPVSVGGASECVDIEFISYCMGTPGDFDRDNDVDVDDLAFLCQHWLESGEADCLGNLDDDCDVDLADFAVFVQYWSE